MLERDIFLGDTNKMVILVDYYNNDLREKTYTPSAPSTTLGSIFALPLLVRSAHLRKHQILTLERTDVDHGSDEGPLQSGEAGPRVGEIGAGRGSVSA